jgi:hypothetical protein
VSRERDCAHLHVMEKTNESIKSRYGRSDIRLDLLQQQSSPISASERIPFTGPMLHTEHYRSDSLIQAEYRDSKLVRKEISVNSQFYVNPLTVLWET